MPYLKNNVTKYIKIKAKKGYIYCNTLLLTVLATTATSKKYFVFIKDNKNYQKAVTSQIQQMVEYKTIKLK